MVNIRVHKRVCILVPAVENIEIKETLPVSAFGRPIPLLKARCVSHIMFANWITVC